MSIPFFYKEDIFQDDSMLVLDEDTSKHIVQVLRMQTREKVKLCNGKGNIFIAEISDNHRKKCTVTIVEKLTIEKSETNICIAISPIKNNSRFEWFLEKATEIGVAEIVPVICERTEKAQLKPERLKGILVSAMLQSQQAWLPILHPPQKLLDYLPTVQAGATKLIAHCIEHQKKSLKEMEPADNAVILIGPEGDFTAPEIEAALNQNFRAVSLGQTRLRTETAAIVAATLLCIQ
ncbi:MAG TPA: RsmE family RNA methyltransferase [Ferruginibacter sp.]|nr:RsmE family RNA methyltransferase [Ferruginibacter sp.]HRE62793.1 RsmE family RNA methyltransferase [Ferruginibacter sp.]